MKKHKIFIACDTTNIAKVKNIIKQSKIGKIKIGYKFGLEFMNSKKGRHFVSKLRNVITENNLKLDKGFFISNGRVDVNDSINFLKNILVNSCPP